MVLARVFLVLALVGLVPAAASAACYTPEQVRAEQWLRLHSELLVITLTCKQASDGRPLPDFYVAFTHKNIDPLHRAEATMTSYYKASAKGSAVSHLDTLRTKLGNEFGQKAGRMTAPQFCLAYRDKVAQFAAAPPRVVEAQVQKMADSEKTYVKACGKAAVKKAKKKGGKG